MSDLESILLVHHSHTDIGFTHDQPVVWDLHLRFMDEALELAHRHSDSDSDGAFRWTVESTLVLDKWLKVATSSQIERFQALEKAGRIEVTGMYLNLTPLLDLDQVVDTFQVLRGLREDYGFDIRYGMNCDVNGQNWPLVDVLLDLGFEGFAMSINQHFGGAPFERPNAFWWEAPSGRKLLTWNSWTYDTGWRYGMVNDERAFEQDWLPRIQAHLKASEFPFPSLMIQSYHPFGDNGSGYDAYTQFIDSWNQRGKTPRLKMITPRQWWDVVKANADKLPTYSGDWTDFWNFGCISSAREQTINRSSRLRLRVSDALAAAAASGFDPSAERARRQWRETAWESVHLFDEHTWGADCAVRDPYCEDTASQWNHKAQYAYRGRSLSHMLGRDAMVALTRLVGGDDPDKLLIFNSLPWSRSIDGPVSKWLLEPRGEAKDGTAGRHFQDRQAQEVSLFGSEGDLEPKLPFLDCVEVPGYGYKVVSKSEIFAGTWQEQASTDQVENAHFRLRFDLKRGGVLSWQDKRSGQEWVDQEAEWPLHGFVHERVDSETSHPWPRRELFAMEWSPDTLSRPRAWQPEWKASRQGPGKVVRHTILRAPFGTRVVQELEAPGVLHTLRQTVYLPDHGRYLEFESEWEMDQQTHPQANYLAFPLALQKPRVRIDLGGTGIEPEFQQLPGTCRDYFTVQRWVDFHDGGRGMTIATPDNPLVQLGGFHFAQDCRKFELEQALFLGWVTNNYWETNFRAHQPGRVSSRYRLAPYAGEYDESRAHRFGLESEQLRPLTQHLGEPALADNPPAGQLLSLPEPPILVLSMKPLGPGKMLMRLLNTSQEAQRFEISSGMLKLERAGACNLLGQETEELQVAGGVLRGSLEARSIQVLELGLSGLSAS